MCRMSVSGRISFNHRIRVKMIENVGVTLLLSLQTERYAKDVERKMGQYEPYNILPLHAVGVKPPIMEIPEVVKMQLTESWSFLHSAH